jgi:hypothetical protein
MDVSSVAAGYADAAASQSQAPLDRKGPAKKPKGSQSLISGQRLMKSFFQAAPAQPMASAARPVPSPHVFESNMPLASESSVKECRDAKGDSPQPNTASHAASRTKRSKSNKDTSAEGATRKALTTLSASHANTTAEGTKAASQGSSQSSAPAASGRSCGAACAKLATSGVLPSAGKQGLANSTALKTRTTAPHKPLSAPGPAELMRDSSLTAQGTDDVDLSRAVDQASATVGSTTGKRAREDGGGSTPGKVQSTDGSEEQHAHHSLPKMSPNPNSLQSYTSPPSSEDRTGSGKEDISPSQDIYDLCARDDEDDMLGELGSPSSAAKPRKRGRAPAHPTAFVFAVPRPPSSTVPADELAATNRPIMGSLSKRSSGGSSKRSSGGAGGLVPQCSRPARGAKAQKGPRSSLLRRGGALSSEMRDLMSLLETQVSRVRTCTNAHMHTCARAHTCMGRVCVYGPSMCLSIAGPAQ